MLCKLFLLGKLAKPGIEEVTHCYITQPEVVQCQWLWMPVMIMWLCFKLKQHVVLAHSGCHCVSIGSESVLSASLKPFLPSNITLLSRSMNVTLT